MCILTVDFGTSSAKIAILDENYNVLDSASVKYDYKVSNLDWVELDPDEVFSAMIKGLKIMDKYLDRIQVIAYDTFSPSMCFMDKDGKMLYPIITHLDRRSKKQTQEILQVMGKDAFQSITGVQPFTGGVSITTILWMMENMPDVIEKTYKLGHLNTYIYHKLTGTWASDPTNASMMGLYETIKWGSWSEQICKAFGISMDKLPPIMMAGTVAGTLTKEIAELTGLTEGIPVALGTNDAASTQIAVGNVNAGDILYISGSSEMISIISDKPIVNDKYYLRNAATPGKWQLFAITNGGFAIDWFRKEFYKDMDADTFFNLEIPDVIQNYIDNTTVSFLPYLSGDRQSLEPKRGAFNGLTLETTRKDMLAAILLGIHGPMIEILDISSKFLSLNKDIKITGGMANEQFLKLKRKLLKGYDFTVRQNCTAIGSGMLAYETLKKTRVHKY